MSNVELYKWGLYLFPVLFVGLYALMRRRRSSKNQKTLNEKVKAGLTEPASLHPVIDPGVCVGCGACVTACPEGRILGLIRGKAKLISPTHCIGHGACKRACPMDAIELVFGTAKRGVDIPLVQENMKLKMLL